MIKEVTQFLLIEDFTKEYHVDSSIDCDQIDVSLILVAVGGAESAGDILGISCHRLTNSNLLAVFDGIKLDTTTHQFHELKRVVGSYKFEIANYTNPDEVDRSVLIKLVFKRNH